MKKRFTKVISNKFFAFFDRFDDKHPSVMLIGAIFLILAPPIYLAHTYPSIRLEHFAAIGTFASSIITAITLAWLIMERRSLQDEKRKDNQWSQATKVSAWITRDTSDPQSPLRLTVLQNSSDTPVYNILVNIVDARNATSRGEQTPKEFRQIIDVLPPGTSYVQTPEGYEGMGFHGVVEIAFEDAHNQSWVRRGNGRLHMLDSRTFTHYKVPLPANFTSFFP